MKVIVSIDSFKGSMSSQEAGEAVKKGIQRVYKDADVEIVPLADGGEGTVDAVVDAMGGVIEQIEVTDPLGNIVKAKYGRVGELAIIEMAEASGLPLVPVDKRNPLITTTYGTGQLIRHAIEKGCRRFIIGIGGSATNDAGIGMLQALGYEFYDEKGKEIPFGGQYAGSVKKIVEEHKVKELEECFFQIASDVNNPLCGLKGASAIYGPQKGATPELVQILDKSLLEFSKTVKEFVGKDYSNESGAGAAGGLGFGCMAFLNSKLESGIEIVLKEIGLEKKLKDADYVVTGEGRLDGQTAMGKAPIGVAKLAKKTNIPVIAFAGGMTEEAVVCNEEGIDAFFTIVKGPVALEAAMEKETAQKNMTDTAAQVFRLIKSVSKDTLH